MKYQQLRKISLQSGLVICMTFSAFSSMAQSIDDSTTTNAGNNSSISNNSNASVQDQGTLNPVAISPKQNFYGKVVGTVSESTSTLINNAMQIIGVRYRWGENVQTGFDASTFVKYVFKDTLGFLFPKKSDDMSKVGYRVSKDKLQPGDLVFFNTLQRENSHVGIYIGENKFIHAPARGAAVRVDDLTSIYWSLRFDGARRVEGGQSDKNFFQSQILENGKL